MAARNSIQILRGNASNIAASFFPKEARGDGNRYREAVLYVDQPTDDNIVSYMIIKNNRFFDFVMNMFAEELPENTDE